MAPLRVVGRGARPRHRHALHVDAGTDRRPWRPRSRGRCSARCARSASLDKTDAYRLLRWGPMAVADLVGESFEHERLRAAVAADGIFGTRLGPWSAGSGLRPAAARRQRSRRRPRVLVRARRAGSHCRRRSSARSRKAGGEIRTSAPGRADHRGRRARAGVVLDDGTEIAARAVISAVDPKQTFLAALRSDRSRAGVPVADAQLSRVTGPSRRSTWRCRRCRHSPACRARR